MLTFLTVLSLAIVCGASIVWGGRNLAMLVLFGVDPWEGRDATSALIPFLTAWVSALMIYAILG